MPPRPRPRPTSARSLDGGASLLRLAIDRPPALRVLSGRRRGPRERRGPASSPNPSSLRSFLPSKLAPSVAAAVRACGSPSRRRARVGLAGSPVAVPSPAARPRPARTGPVAQARRAPPGPLLGPPRCHASCRVAFRERALSELALVPAAARASGLAHNVGRYVNSGRAQVISLRSSVASAPLVSRVIVPSSNRDQPPPRRPRFPPARGPSRPPTRTPEAAIWGSTVPSDEPHRALRAPCSSFALLLGSAYGVASQLATRNGGSAAEGPASLRLRHWRASACYTQHPVVLASSMVHEPVARLKAKPLRGGFASLDPRPRLVGRAGYARKDQVWATSPFLVARPCSRQRCSRRHRAHQPPTPLSRPPGSRPLVRKPARKPPGPRSAPPVLTYRLRCIARPGASWSRWVANCSLPGRSWSHRATKAGG